ncbi:MAG: putative membrane protein, partial [uncultured Arthrobacter sp.]
GPVVLDSGGRLRVLRDQARRLPGACPDPGQSAHAAGRGGAHRGAADLPDRRHHGLLGQRPRAGCAARRSRRGCRRPLAPGSIPRRGRGRGARRGSGAAGRPAL